MKPKDNTLYSKVNSLILETTNIRKVRYCNFRDPPPKAALDLPWWAPSSKPRNDPSLRRSIMVRISQRMLSKINQVIAGYIPVGNNRCLIVEGESEIENDIHNFPFNVSMILGWKIGTRRVTR